MNPASYPEATPQRHPNVHPAWSGWSEEQTLHVIAPYTNPLRYRTRRELFLNFLDHMRQCPNVRLHVVELAFGARPFEVTTGERDELQLRTSSILWHKENLIDLGVHTLPQGWHYAGYADGDFHFTRHDWALETIHQLQLAPWVQMFSSYSPLSLDHRPIQNRPSFAYAYHAYFGARSRAHRLPGAEKIENYCALSPTEQTKILNTTPGATGGAWAFTAEGYDQVGGLLDTCVLGAADWYMAFGLVGNEADGHPEAVECGPAYVDSIRRWQARAYAAVKGNIGVVDNYCTHGWHGDVRNRGYGERWKILRDHAFDPLVDVHRDRQGVLTWSGNKPQLELDVKRYFLSRNEDSTEMHTKALL